MPVIPNVARCAALAVLTGLGGLPAQSAPQCKPAIVPKATLSSDVINQQRRWTGIFAVDASQCATGSGTFAISGKEVRAGLAFTVTPAN